MKYTNEELQEAYNELVRKQSASKTIIGGIVGAFFACGTYYFFAKIQFVLFFIPPLFVGFFAKLNGQPYEVKPRIPVAIIAAIVHIIGMLLFNIQPLLYLFTPVAAGIAFSVAKKKLTKIERVAVEAAEYGKINKKTSN